MTQAIWFDGATPEDSQYALDNDPTAAEGGVYRLVRQRDFETFFLTHGDIVAMFVVITDYLRDRAQRDGSCSCDCHALLSAPCNGCGVVLCGRG